MMFVFMVMTVITVIKDICDGSLYQTLKSNSAEDFLTLRFNCDGVPVFQSSKFSIWPLLCCVNEIPPEIRAKHVLLRALWFGSQKPAMSCFLKPFVEEWKHPSDQSLRHIKVHTLCCVCDAVARPLLQNFKQFNSEYGCMPSPWNANKERSRENKGLHMSR